jgi:hypothetical protein
MSRNPRLSVARIARIAGWTAMATAWVAAIMARVTGTGGTVSPSTVPDQVAPPGVEQSADARAVLPALPEGGLLVLRIGGAPEVAPMGAPVVVTPAPQPASSPETVPAPPPVTSQGS